MSQDSILDNPRTRNDEAISKAMNDDVLKEAFQSPQPPAKNKSSRAHKVTKKPKQRGRNRSRRGNSARTQ